MPNWHISCCNFVAKAIFKKIKKTQHAGECSLQVPKEIFSFPSILNKWRWPKNHHFRRKNSIFSIQTQFPCACAFARVYVMRVRMRVCAPTDALQNFSNFLIKLVSSMDIPYFSCNVLQMVVWKDIFHQKTWF